MSFRNPTSSHLNDNARCWRDQMFRSQRDEWHLTKQHLCRGNYAAAVSWRATAALQGGRETNMHNAAGHQPIRRSILIRALQKLSHFKRKKKILYFFWFGIFSLNIKLIIDNFQTSCFTHQCHKFSYRARDWMLGFSSLQNSFAPELGVWVTSFRVCKSRFAFMM